jgi:hypothetical protein
MQTPAFCDRERELELQKLKRKLSKARAQSRDRLVNAEQVRTQLSSENLALRQECESLRSLFIRQQQQQIAFWSGPFMEMILPKNAPLLSADDLSNVSMPRTKEASAGMIGTLGETWDTLKENVDGNLLTKPGSETILKSSCETDACKSTELHDVDADAAQAGCVQSLLKDRDYWRQIASKLQTGTCKDAPIVHLSLDKDPVDTRSTSHRSSASSASECGHNAEGAWSDSGTDS